MEERGDLNLYRPLVNNPVTAVDAFGFKIKDPPANLGFTLEDVEFAVRLAHKCGIRGPDGMSLLRMYLQMLQCPETLSWRLSNSSDTPATLVYPPTSRNPEITWPKKADPKSRQKDTPGTGGSMFYFHAAVLHELVHAYGRMTGQGDLDRDAVRVGNELNRLIDEMLNRDQPD